jgi:hypothetical protein
VDADLGALLRYRQQLNFNVVADQHALASPAPQH